MKYGIHVLPSELSGWAISFIDRFMINSIKGPEFTGIYSTSYRVGQASQIVYDSVNKAFLPFSFARYSDPESNRNAVSQSILLVFTLFTVVAFLIALFYKEIIFILDDRYSSGVKILLIIVFAFLFDGYRLIFNVPISYNLNFVKYRSIIFVATGILNIFLNLVLIPKYSIFGAAISLLISFFIRFLVIFFVSLKALNINYYYKKMLQVFGLSMFLLSLTFFHICWYVLIIKSTALIIIAIIYLKICSINLLEVSKKFLKS